MFDLAANKKTEKIGEGKRGPGRPKGTPNKITAHIKEAILAAADAQQGGATGYLTRQAQENPIAFMGLLGKVLPLQIAGDKENPVHHAIEWRVIDPNS